MSQSLIGLVARVELRLSKRNDFAAALFYLLCVLGADLKLTQGYVIFLR